MEQIVSKNKNKEIILAGDSNIDLLKHDSYLPAQNLIDYLSPVISRPTHISDRYTTLIDHIYTNSLSNFRSSGVITDPLADHLGIYIKIGYKANKQTKKTTSYYSHTDYSNDNIEHFHRLLINTDWSPLTDTENPNDKFNAFHTIFSTHYEKSFPKSNKKCNDRKAEGKPWIMPWLQEACKRKNACYHKYMKSPTYDNKLAYKKMKKWVEKQIYIRKKKYYSDQIEKYVSNSKKQWKIMNEVISNTKPKIKITKLKLGNETITNNSLISETFNNYFCSIAEKLKNEIPITTPNHRQSLTHPIQNSIYLEPCTIPEIIDIIKKLKNSTTSDFNVAVIKEVNGTISDYLCQTINSSLLHGVFPEHLKTAKVIPIYKSGSKSEVSNYRPISLLSIFSKVYEKVMYARLASFFAKNSVIYSRQYGFRPLHSCEHALLDAQNTLLSTLDKKQIALLLLIDFSKAFDMVDHSTLLNKLSNYGIRGVALNWMKSYLNNRKQFVNVNNTSSTIQGLKYGVPQGSILGPLLFIIYINDLPNISTNVHFIMYADDANIIITGSTMDEIKSKTHALLTKLTEWVNLSALKLNVKKTHYMIFANSGNFNINLKLGNEDITQTHQERFLGVLIDDKLSWTSHRAAIAKRISRNAGIFFRARHMFKISTLKTLYYSFIQSHLIYCSSIWGTGSRNSLQKIFIAQKKSVRAITFTDLYTKDQSTQLYSYGHTKYLFNSNGILTVHNLILVQLLMQMHKIYISIAPSHTQSMFITHAPPLQETPTVSTDNNSSATHKKLLKLGLDTNNILLEKKTLTYYTIPFSRLKKQQHSPTYLGPITYNHYCNKIQTTFNFNNTKYEIHELTPKGFNSHIKKEILSEQARGEANSWEACNTPLYSITTSTTVLRAQN